MGSAAGGGGNGPIEQFGGGRRRHRSVVLNPSIGDPLGRIPLGSAAAGGATARSNTSAAVGGGIDRSTRIDRSGIP